MFEFKLKENEKILAMRRKSEVVLFKPVALVFIAIYVPWYFLLKYGLVNDYKKWLVLWTFLVFAYALYVYLLWLLNVYLITDKRVVLVHYKNLFSKAVTESPFDHIGNISFKTTGFFSSLFNFGEVEIQITGLSRAIMLAQIKNPSEIKDLLWQLKAKAGGLGTLNTYIKTQHI